MKIKDEVKGEDIESGNNKDESNDDVITNVNDERNSVHYDYQVR